MILKTKHGVPGQAQHKTRLALKKCRENHCLFQGEVPAGGFPHCLSVRWPNAILEGHGTFERKLNAAYDLPWALTFSYGRALQAA